MSAGLPLLILSILSIVVVVTWRIKGDGDAGRRQTIATAWGLLLAASWAAVMALGSDDPRGSAAALLAFVVALAGLFVPQLHKWASRGR
jgi:peptidoglycan/LPS O-acetylase OafA/YrhL